MPISIDKLYITICRILLFHSFFDNNDIVIKYRKNFLNNFCVFYLISILFYILK